jgi:hypothetical protein
VRGIYGACMEATRRLALLPKTCRRSLPLRYEGSGSVEMPKSMVCVWACRGSGCFNACAIGILERAQASNRPVFSFPGPILKSCYLPIPSNVVVLALRDMFLAVGSRLVAESRTRALGCRIPTGSGCFFLSYILTGTGPPNSNKNLPDVRTRT